MTETKLYDDLKRSVQDLEKYSTEFDHSCAKNAVAVLRDTEVQETFVKHIRWEEDFVGLSCHGLGRDSVEIVFRFQCRAPRICFIAPAFAVQYDRMTNTIIQIIDPYIGKNLLPAAH